VSGSRDGVLTMRPSASLQPEPYLTTEMQSCMCQNVTLQTGLSLIYAADIDQACITSIHRRELGQAGSYNTILWQYVVTPILKELL
jgi:hypothetical protein